MIYKGHNLREIFPSNLECLDLIYTAENMKPCCRLMIDNNSLRKIRPILKDLKMSAVLSDYKLATRIDKGKGSFANTMIIIDKHAKEGVFFIYISRKKDLAQLAKHYDAKQNDKKIGSLFGYPSCCRKFFDKHKEEAKKHQFDFIPYLKEKTGNFQLNYGIRYFDIALIGHFPCSLHCSKSLEIAQSNYLFLKKEYPLLAQLFKQELKSIVFYTETEGIGYAKEYALDPLQAIDLQVTQETKTMQDIRKGRLADSVKTFIFE
jgi:hypothetical protein